MQLFILHPVTYTAARKLAELCPLRARKQIIETNQALSTLFPDRPMFKKGDKSTTNRYSTRQHKNHPVTKWITKSKENLQWTLAFQFELCRLYPEHAASISFMDWVNVESGEVNFLGLVEHEYFGTPSIVVEGYSVYQKYHNYILIKQGV